MNNRSRFFPALLSALVLVSGSWLTFSVSADEIKPANHSEAPFTMEPAGEGKWVILFKEGVLEEAKQKTPTIPNEAAQHDHEERYQVLLRQSHMGEAFVPKVVPATPNFFGDDVFTIEFMLGLIKDGLLQCLREQMAGMDDNSVLFDGLSELLDPYLNGTQPLAFEFESTSMENPENNTANLFGLADDDLFPEGFEDPETGTPLDFGCVELGVDDTLDSSEPLNVVKAELEFYSSGTGSLFGPLDITSTFDSPFDGRLSIGLLNIPGQDIDEVQLRMEFQPQDIFADGFESGDATSWTDSVE